MTETEADDYKLNAEGIQQTLHVSLINNNQIALILINFSKNLRYSSYLSLQSLKKLSGAFSEVKTIQEALTIIKNTIESGNIALSQDPKDNSMAINFEITLASGSFPEFEVNLNLEESQNNNDQEELPVTFDYQGNVEAQLKYGNSKNSTTEYNKPIIKSDIKPPIVQLEYIEPILQVHYPDGTTKRKALPPRIQGPNGEKANISEEQFKLIQEQMGNNNISTSKKFSPIKDNYNLHRSNSLTKSETSMYSTQTMPYHVSRNMANKNPFGNNVVRNALNDNANNTNINQVRSAFSVNPNQTTNLNTINNMKYNNSYYMNNGGNSFQTPNPINFNNTAVYPSSHYMTQTHNVRNVMEERRPRMTTNVNNMPKTTTRSLSTPGRENTNTFNPNRAMYQANQVNYGYQANNMGTINTPYGNNNIPQRQAFNPNVNVVHLPTQELNSYNQNNNGNYGQTYMNQPNNNNLLRPNMNNSQAMKLSQELIQRHQKRLLEVQRQLAQIQQQQQKLQEAQRQLMKQQQYQRQMIQKQTLVNRSNSQVLPNLSKPQSKFKGFAEVSQINKNQQYNTQIRQAQTITNNQTNQPFVSKTSQEIKQTKTTFNQDSNHPLRTQSSTPMSFQAPSLQSYQTQTSKNTIDDEIPEQQIALAQMASMQNQANPNYQNLQAITLQQREEEIQPEQEENQEQEQEQEQVQVQEEEQQQPEQTTEGETEGEQGLDIEALFMTEEGRIIFRNGLLRGIIHKYAEIDDVISKIQDILLKGVKFSLVYKAFDVGDKAETFHQKCDKLDMSLVLIETDNDVRFGGFTTKSWEGNNIKKKDNNAFVFNLETNSIFDIIKNEPAIGCYPKFGPVFFGCQIRIYDEFFTKGGTTCHKGLNYKTKKDYELNNGEQKYLIKDIEVYSIEAIDV